MSRASRKWLLRVLLLSLVVVALLVIVALLVLGTERGTRFALRQVAAYSPLEIDSENTRGTLLSEVVVPMLAYHEANISIEVERIALNIDWSESGFRSLVIDHLFLTSIGIESFGTEPAEKKPLEISMPALPVEFFLRHGTVDALQFDQLAVTGIELRQFRARRTRMEMDRAAATVDNLSAKASEVFVDLDGDVPLGGKIEWRLLDSNISGEGILAGSLRQVDVSHRLDGDYRVATQGTVQLLHRLSPAFDLDNEFAELAYAEWSATDGQVHVAGTLDHFRVAVDSKLAAEDRITAVVRGTAAGNLQGFDELDVAATIDGSELQANGRIAWAPGLLLELRLSGRNVNPASFSALPASSLDAELQVKAAAADDFAVDILALDGLWNEQPAGGTGRLLRRPDSWNCRACRVVIGNNRVMVDGGLRGQTLSGAVDIDAPALTQLWPGLSGALTGNGQLGGTLSLPMISGQIRAEALEFRRWSLAFASVQSEKSTPRDLDVAIEVAELALGGTTLGSGEIDVSGTEENVDVTATWNLDDYSASLQARAAADDDVLSGSIETARLSEPLSGTWTLENPAGFSFTPGEIRLAAAAWNNGEARLAHEEIVQRQDSLDLAASLSNGPLIVFNNLLPQNVRLDGSVDATVALQYGPAGWNGNVEWRQRDTVLRFIASEDEHYDGHVPLALLTVQLEDNSVTIRAEARSENGTEGSLDAYAERLAVDTDLRARLQFGGDQWDWVPMLVPDIDNFSGRINADIRATGTMRSPDLQGDLTWTRGELAVPTYNLPLTDIDVTLSGSSAGDMTISGDARSGEGSLQVRGRLDDVTSLSPSFDIRLLGQRATLMDWEEILLVASPELEFAGDTRGVHVTGRVAVDKAEILISELPEGAVTPSDDVSVVGREPDARERTRVTGDVELMLSEDVHIRAFGLDTNLEGELRFFIPANRAPQGTGELRLVGGVFEAYGQRLVIESGTMVFTGPLDDPLINVRAVRSIDSIDGTVTVGIQLSGRTQALTSTLFSDPAMSEAEALSYLVLGRPLSQATAADGSNLSNSAYSLGLRQAALVTNQIGQAVGLDELTVGGSNQNTTELIAGKQINSRLYARFAYGVFNRLGRLLMRYKLTESLSIEIGTGESQSMDILYTIERE